MLFAVFNEKRRYRLKLDGSLAEKEAGGRRQQDSTQENMMLNAAGEEILHRRIYTATILRTEAFTQREVCAQTRLYTQKHKDYISEAGPHAIAFTPTPL